MCRLRQGIPRILPTPGPADTIFHMDLYTVSLATGAVGLGVMALGGLSHGGHAGSSHAGHGHAGAHTGAHGAHAAHAAHGHHDEVLPHGPSAGGWSWASLLSPRLLFSLMVGFGAGGMATAALGEPWQFGAAIVVAAAFETLLVGPMWRFLFRFESQPASTLESAIEDEARAVTGFDANGNGLVAVDVDGQVIQLLATLAPEERASGVRIHSGDTVRVSEIDAARGRCTVTRTNR